MAEVLFVLCSAAGLLSALGVIFSRQAIQSVLWMFALLLCLSGLMVALGAYLLAVVTLLVYAGAILVLFAFVVMFMGQRASPKATGAARIWWAIMALLGLAVLILPLTAMPQPPQIFTQENSLPRTVLYGPELFARYQVPAQLAAWLILWSAVGAFNVLGAPRKKEVAS